MVDSLIREIELRSSFLKNEIENDFAVISPGEIIETIYFGGGTPSLLLKDEIISIIDSIKQNYCIADDAEITLEANPDDISLEKLYGWEKAGINRLSIGIQSFIDRDLKWMNRGHNAKQAFACIMLARKAGFQNFSTDLIFGTPGLINEEWKENVQKVIQLDVPHIACYALTVEPKTALQKMIDLKKKKNIDSDIQAAQYSLLMKMVRDAGYEHYEISNFAKPGFRSRHNSCYWQGKKYIGIGPSAHSYDGKMRMWNKANNGIYIKSIGENRIPFKKEILTQSQKLNEYIMTSLRTMEGMNLQFIENNFSINERKRIENVIKNELGEKMFFVNESKIILTDEGRLFADGIAVKLFV